MDFSSSVHFSSVVDQLKWRTKKILWENICEMCSPYGVSDTIDLFGKCWGLRIQQIDPFLQIKTTFFPYCDS